MSAARRVGSAAAVLFVLGWVALAVLVDGYTIPSRANDPTLQPGDRVAVLARSNASRGDLVVFEARDGDERVGRVVAVGGDTVDARDGRLVVNGERVDEPYLARGTTTEMREPVDVPDGHVFILGDNRTNSADSRAFGPFDADGIRGRVVFRYWPLSRLGGV